jgi:putative ABC transport system ATP-binding protein
LTPAQKVAATPGAPLVQVRGLTKIYRRGSQEITVLNDLDLDIAAGSFEALMGPSGSGKTTLLNLIAGLDEPTRGSVRVAGQDLGRLSERERSAWRARNIGFVFQFYNLLPQLSAAENVELPLLLTRLAREERRRRVRVALRLVGLEDRLEHKPRELSGGQQQRVAIARALVADPAIVVADEPTGDLDRQSAEEALRLLVHLNQSLGKTILMVTHDPRAFSVARVHRHLVKGVLT